MIIIKIYGGLGNQMFQYAFGKALALKYNRKLVIDNSYFEKEGYPIDLHAAKFHYRLNLYHTTKNISESWISKYIKWIKYKKIYFLANLFSFVPIINRFVPKLFTHHNFSFRSFEKSKIAYLDGYWQSFNLIEEFKKQIENELQLSDCLIPKTTFLNQIRSTNSVAVHFRLGDYISNPQCALVYERCSLDYYKNAMNQFQENSIKPIFYIFSDDQEWVKVNLQADYSIVFVDNQLHDYEDLYLMSQCKHNIIANSSFSWWGAWLNDNPEKNVIAPKKWFIAAERQKDVFYPQKWKKIYNI